MLNDEFISTTKDGDIAVSRRVFVTILITPDFTDREKAASQKPVVIHVRVVATGKDIVHAGCQRRHDGRTPTQHGARVH